LPKTLENMAFRCIGFWLICFLLVIQSCADTLLERFHEDNSEETLRQVREEAARLIQEQLIKEQAQTGISPERNYQEENRLNQEFLRLNEERRLQQVEALAIEAQRLRAAELEARLQEEKRLQQEEAIAAEAQRLRAAEVEARLQEERGLKQEEAIAIEAQRLSAAESNPSSIMDSSDNLSGISDIQVDTPPTISGSPTAVRETNISDEYSNDSEYVDEALEEILQLQRQEEEDLLRIENDIVNDAVIVEELEKKDREKKEEEEAKQRAAFQDSTRSKIIDGAGRGAGVGGLLGKGKKVGSGLNRGKGTKVTPDGILSSESPINSQKSKVSMGMMGGGANSMNAQLEELLYQQNAESVKSEYSPTTNRNKFPREIARPVERIIAIYNDPKTDLYDVLGVPFDADGYDLKIRYRQLALSIHPDKNPHPDAKQAFEYIQEAFETLSLPLKRIEYNNKIRKGKPMKLNYKKIKRRIYNEYINWRSRIELFVYRVKHGEVQAEYDELVNQPLQAIKSKLLQLKGKFVDLPSDYDRIHYLSELYFDNWKLLLRNFFVTRLLLLPLC
jgi:hypothetical protein